MVLSHFLKSPQKFGKLFNIGPHKVKSSNYPSKTFGQPWPTLTYYDKQNTARLIY